MVSVLFVDLVGYTSLSEARDAEDVRALQSRYFDAARTLAAYRGEHGRAGSLLQRAAPYWEHTDDVDDRGLYSAAAATLELAEGRLEPGFERARATIEVGIDVLGAHHDSVRPAWPEAVHTAIAIGELDLAGELVARMASRPVGRVPPLLRAELPRAQGMLAAARGEHSAPLDQAIATFASLGAAPALARARTLATAGGPAAPAASAPS